MPLFGYNLKLGRRVRTDNSLRMVREKFDFKRVRNKVAHCYGHSGNGSVGRSATLKLLFPLFFDGINTERELLRNMPGRIDCLRFLGCGHDDEIGDHIVLSLKNEFSRERLNSFFSDSTI